MSSKIMKFQNIADERVTRLIFACSHVSFARGVTLLDLDLFWGVQSRTRHWAI